MDDLDLLIDLHLDAPRLGPGGDDETCFAIRLSGLASRTALRIADIGCGTGASALLLARALDARITAVDLLPAFLERLDTAAKGAGLSARIDTLAASMDALPFPDQAFDALWAEGAVYNMGFAAGVQAWRRFLKPGGILAVSDLTWLTRERPSELERYWTHAYPEVDTAAGKLAVLEARGFSPVGYFPLPPSCWLDTYYRPLRSRFPEFLARHGYAAAAADLVAAQRAEIDLYERYRDYVSYGFYIARRVAHP